MMDQQALSIIMWVSAFLFFLGRPGLLVSVASLLESIAVAIVAEHFFENQVYVAVFVMVGMLSAVVCTIRFGVGWLDVEMPARFAAATAIGAICIWISYVAPLKGIGLSLESAIIAMILFGMIRFMVSRSPELRGISVFVAVIALLLLAALESATTRAVLILALACMIATFAVTLLVAETSG